MSSSFGGDLKLNSDAAVFQDGSVGLGFVVRDRDGAVKLAGNRRCVASSDNSTLIEALALRFRLKAFMTMGLQISTLESDSSNLVSALLGNTSLDACSMLVVEDIAEMVNEEVCHTFSFVKRGANRLAHTLAHADNRVDSEKIWIDVIPDSCINVALDDVRPRA
ncbi:hypothetical protein ACS0TY_031743 [Phlomoides rotata]